MITPPTNDRSCAQNAFSFAHREIVVNGVRLHYVEAGAGPLAILLHGFPEFWYGWRRQIPALAAAGFRVVAPDLRGYNLSDKPRGRASYHIDVVATDIAELITSLGETSASVIGHDWGGIIAWEVAMRFGDRVADLVVLNAPHLGPFMPALQYPAQLLRSWYAFFFRVPTIPEALLRWNNAAVMVAALRRMVTDPRAITDDDLAAYRAAWAQPGALTASINYYRALLDRGFARVQSELRPIPHRTLVVWGERDLALQPELLTGLPRWVPNLTIVRAPRAGHFVQLDAPEIVNGALLSFLAGDRRATSGIP